MERWTAGFLAATLAFGCGVEQPDLLGPCRDGVRRVEHDLDEGRVRIDLHPSVDRLRWERAEVVVVGADAVITTRVVQADPEAMPTVDPNGTVRLAPGGDATWTHCMLPEKVTLRCVTGGPTWVAERDDEGHLLRLASDQESYTWTWDECGRPATETAQLRDGTHELLYAYLDEGHLSGWTRTEWQEAPDGSVPVVTEAVVDDRRSGRASTVRLQRDGQDVASLRWDSKGRPWRFVDEAGSTDAWRYHGAHGLPVYHLEGGTLMYEEHPIGGTGPRWRRHGELIDHEVHEQPDAVCIAPVRFNATDWAEQWLEDRANDVLNVVLSPLSPGPY